MSETTYKVGDKVRVIDRQCQYFDRVGEVRQIETGDFGIGVTGFGGELVVWFNENEIASEELAANDAVNHPSHYGGADNPYEVIKVAEAWGLDKDAYLFNVLKYIGRADKKGASLQDHKKAAFYLARKIQNMEGERA